MPGSEKRHREKDISDTQRDRVDRPQPSLDAVEGDLETIEESLRQHELQAQKPTERKKGAA